jgi:hypothetical protein
VFLGVESDTELREYGAGVCLDGAQAHVLASRDAVVGQPFSHEGERLLFSVGKNCERVGGGGGAVEELGDDRRIDGAAAVRDSAYRVEEVLDLQYPVLSR